MATAMQLIERPVFTSTRQPCGTGSTGSPPTAEADTASLTEPERGVLHPLVEGLPDRDAPRR